MVWVLACVERHVHLWHRVRDCINFSNVDNSIVGWRQMHSGFGHYVPTKIVERSNMEETSSPSFFVYIYIYIYLRGHATHYIEATTFMKKDGDVRCTKIKKIQKETFFVLYHATAGLLISLYFVI